MFVSPPDSCVETLIPDVISLGGGALWRLLGHEGEALTMKLVPL